MNYSKWNYEIMRYFFNRNVAHREVILFVDGTVINEIGKPFDADLNDFIRAVKMGPEYSDSKHICVKAYQTFLGWRKRNIKNKYPPYIAYLALFVLAADIEGDFSSAAYYPRLRQVLDLPADYNMKDFERMSDLWYDLGKWAKEDKKGRFGNFTARILGYWRYVGMPLSQLLITRSEREEVLPYIFAKYGFDSIDLPSEHEILSALIEAPQIRAKTKSFLTNTKEEYLRNALLEIFMLELEQWEGISKENKVLDVSERLNAKLLLCLSYDDFTESITSSVRIKSSRDYPDDDLEYRRSGENESTLFCFPSVELMSSTLLTLKGQRSFNASLLDWLNGETLFHDDPTWNAKLSNANVRIFTSGKQYGIEWMEVQRVESGTPYLICCHFSVRSSIDTWAKSHCLNYQILSVVGLPQGWYLGRVEAIVHSHATINKLKLPVLCRIKLEGGIKSSKGNSYFSFASPKIVVEGNWDGGRPLANGEELEVIGGRSWRLSGSLANQKSITIELSVNDVVKYATFHLEEPRLAEKYTPIKRDKFGAKCVEETSISIKGTLNDSDDVLYIRELSKKVIYVGRIPGQITRWPMETEPATWEPVWAVIQTLDGRWVPQIIAKDNLLPIGQQKLRDWKKWRKIFRVIPVVLVESPPIIRELWNTYKNEANRI